MATSDLGAGANVFGGKGRFGRINLFGKVSNARACLVAAAKLTRSFAKFAQVSPLTLQGLPGEDNTRDASHLLVPGRPVGRIDI